MSSSGIMTGYRLIDFLDFKNDWHHRAKRPTWLGNTIGVEELYGTATPCCIDTDDHTLVSVERSTLPANTGVAELATTVGSDFGTPGDELTCAIMGR